MAIATQSRLSLRERTSKAFFRGAKVDEWRSPCKVAFRSAKGRVKHSFAERKSTNGDRALFVKGVRSRSERRLCGPVGVAERQFAPPRPLGGFFSGQGRTLGLGLVLAVHIMDRRIIAPIGRYSDALGQLEVKQVARQSLVDDDLGDYLVAVRLEKRLGVIGHFGNDQSSAERPSSSRETLRDNRRSFARRPAG